MKFEFIKIVNNKFISNYNERKIEVAFNNGDITKSQMKLLLANNAKWHDTCTCSHNGLLGVKDNKIIFVPRTSYDYVLAKPRTLEHLKVNTKIESVNEQKIEFYRFNDKCNIGSLKCILGNATDQIETQSLEDRHDIVAKLVGSLEDLEYFKEWVRNTELEEFDISPYFDIDQAIEELASSNLNIIDE